MQVRVPSADVPATIGDAAGDLADDDLEHVLPLVLVEPRDLAGHAERGHAVDACVDEQVDHPPQAVVVDVPGGRERRRQNGIHPVELHDSSFGVNDAAAFDC